MKKIEMKKNQIQFALFFIMSFCLISCSEEGLVFEEERTTIESLLNATLIDGSSQEELSTAKIKSEWEKTILEESGRKVSLSKFILIKVGGSDSRFFLKSISEDGLVKTGAFISLDQMGRYKMGGKKCTCTGQCGSGCDLRVTGNQCSCSDCFPSGDCVKTETQTIEE